MRLLIAVSVVVLVCSAACAEDEHLVRNIRWSEIQESGQKLAGEIRRGEGDEPEEILVITNAEDLPLTVSLLTITDPGIAATQYALKGSVAYEGVRDVGYLEMWNYFPGGGAYFSRTLGEFGPMGRIQGTSSWRSFLLPFISDAKTGVPNKLEFNLVLPASGTVKLGPVQLVEYPHGLAAVTQPGAWWSDRAGNLFGGIGGGICGCLGALIGVLSSLGRARRFVLSLCTGIVICGVLCLVAGGVAWTTSQPFAVYYPLLLGGTISTAVVGGAIPTIRRRYDEIEIRRMASMDVDTLGV